MKLPKQLPSLIVHARAKQALPKLPKGTQPMLDKVRAAEVARLHQRIANLQQKINLTAMIDSAAVNASVLPELEMQLHIAKLELDECLASYSANSEVSNG